MENPRLVLVNDLFPEILDALLALLRNLAMTDWNRPAVSGHWTVKDVALHLLGDDMGLISARRDDFSQESPAIRNWNERVDWLNQRNNTWVQTARWISPRLLCALLKFTGDQVYDYFRSLDLNAVGRPVSWAGPEPAPVWLDVAREFTERWHHQQHIRDAVGKPGLSEPRYLAPVLATFVHALPRTFQNIVAREGTSVSLTITGDSGGSWSVIREQKRWRLYAGKPAQPDAHVELPEDVAWRVFTKGMPKQSARTRAIFQGDQALGDQLLETVSIIA